MNIRWSAALAVSAALIASGCAGAEEEPAPSQHYYLSLGDSLAVGVQPDENGRMAETSDGYTDVLHRTLYDGDSTLRHERMGCGGEDTATFLDGGLEHCSSRYEEGSQLRQAEAFLAENGDDVSLITLTIGANNFTRCVAGQDGDDLDLRLDGACVEEGMADLEEEVPEIADRLRRAAGPDTQIIGMTYYNPFLAALLLGGDAEQTERDEDSDAPGEMDGRELAEYATQRLTEMNEVLHSAYSAADIDVADVSEAFESTDFEVPADSDTGLPANVQKICDLTWMCNTAQGPDIHTNREGAQEIAAVFARIVELP